MASWIFREKSASDLEKEDGYHSRSSKRVWWSLLYRIQTMFFFFVDFLICKIAVEHSWFIMFCFLRLAYFHEDIEPRITHQDIRPTKILLDYRWNPKMILSITSHSDIPTNSTFVPSPANLDDKIDVHCFGTLIMELVSGRVSVDQNSPNVRSIYI